MPWWTLAICAGVLIVFFGTGLNELLIYDRTAIIHGEIWRLLTGNLVHYSAVHLAYNLLAFFVTGSIMEIRAYRFFPTLFFSSALLIGITLFMFEPALNYFAGISGVVTAAVCYLCLQGLSEQGLWRWLCAAILAGLAAKTGIELMLGKFLLLAVSESAFVPVPLSHAAGMLAALFLHAAMRLEKAVERSRTV